MLPCSNQRNRLLPTLEWVHEFLVTVCSDALWMAQVPTRMAEATQQEQVLREESALKRAGQSQTSYVYDCSVQSNVGTFQIKWRL